MARPDLAWLLFGVAFLICLAMVILTGTDFPTSHNKVYSCLLPAALGLIALAFTFRFWPTSPANV